MKIIKRKSGQGFLFYFQRTVNGKQRKFPLGDKESIAKSRLARFEKTVATTGLDAAIAELEGENPVKRGQSYTHEDMVKLYRKYLATAKALRPKTIYDNINALKRIMTACGADNIGQLDTHKIRQTMLPENPTPQQERGFSDTIRQARSIFKVKAMIYYEAQGNNVPNPLKDVEISAPIIEPYTPTPEAVRQKIRQNPDFDPQENQILLLGIECGLRKSEIEACRIQWFSVQTDRVFLSIQEADGFKPKGRRKRMFPIDKDLFEEMNALREQTDPTDDFFVHVKKRKMVLKKDKVTDSRLDRRFKRVNAWLKENGFPGVGKLRAEAGSKVAANAGIFEAQRVLGHASPTTTAQHYANILNLKTVGGKVEIKDQLEDVAKALNMPLEDLKKALAEANSR